MKAQATVKNKKGNVRSSSVVRAKKRGSSGLPVVAQAAVPAESCDLTRRIIEAEKRVFHARLARREADFEQDLAEMELADLERQYEATKTHVGGKTVKLTDAVARNVRREKHS